MRTKFSPLYDGPFRVVTKVATETYKVERTTRNSPKILPDINLVNARRIKRFIFRQTPTQLSSHSGRRDAIGSSASVATTAARGPPCGRPLGVRAAPVQRRRIQRVLRSSRTTDTGSRRTGTRPRRSSPDSTRWAMRSAPVTSPSNSGSTKSGFSSTSPTTGTNGCKRLDDSSLTLVGWEGARSIRKLRRTSPELSNMTTGGRIRRVSV